MASVVLCADSYSYIATCSQYQKSRHTVQLASCMHACWLYLLLPRKLPMMEGYATVPCGLLVFLLICMYIPRALKTRACVQLFNFCHFMQTLGVLRHLPCSSASPPQTKVDGSTRVYPFTGLNYWNTGLDYFESKFNQNNECCRVDCLTKAQQ